ncbi:MAG TPA: sugar ABC transporter permease [Spirochaetia bacterium]|nr:sugar ABC transporter permease [Spirochaetia bacterium]
MDTRERTWIRTKNYLPYAVLLVPAFAFYTVFGIVPVFRAIYTSTTDWSGLGTSYHFVGLANYISLFTDTNVLWTFQATFEYTLSVTVFQNVISIILAFILNQNLKSRNVLRSLIFMPTLFSGLIMGYIWSFLYSEPIMELGKAIHSTVLGNNVLGSQNFAIFAAAFMDIWRGTGYTMVIYIAGLQNIPFELEDAANIDGANVIQRFRYLTLPLLAPATTICVILTFERCLKNFDSIFALTAGGPGDATMVMAINIYRQSFYFQRAGYGTAIGVTLFLFILILSLLQLRLFKRGEENASL